MLPALPRSFGKLSDVFVSALGSITGSDNRLSLPRVKQAAVFLIDGLGAHNLRAAAGHAPFLNAALRESSTIGVGFPTTTATSITSFATGLPSAAHGIIGYSVWDSARTRVANLLSGWDELQDPLEWQPHQTVSETAIASGVPAFVIGPGEYQGSGFTNATMRGASYLSGKTIDDRFEALTNLKRRERSFLAYSYLPELDQIAHASGWKSNSWLAKLEEIDSKFRVLSQQLGSEIGVLVTADHGVIDVPIERHIYLDSFDLAWPDHFVVAGDPRVLYLYCDENSVGSLQNQLSELLLGDALVVQVDHLLEAGWLGNEVGATAARLMPQLVVMATAPVALYDRRFANPKSLRMIGQHGSLSQEELAVPLIKLGGYRT